MSKRSYLWRQAEVCLSRARVSGDPVLKELYEDLAAEFAHDAACEQNLDSLKNSELESREKQLSLPAQYRVRDGQQAFPSFERHNPMSSSLWTILASSRHSLARFLYSATAR